MKRASWWPAGSAGTAIAALLAACVSASAGASAGALRRYLERKGALPQEPLTAMVPVSVRQESEKHAFGNRVSSILTDLATDEIDPEKRLARIHLAMKAAKREDAKIDG